MKAYAIFGAKDFREINHTEVDALAPEQVRIKYRTGGICGSDIHYYHEGRVGNFAVKEPLILGHEVAGEVMAVGSAVNQLHVGQRVVINPSLPCLDCGYCLDGKTNLCEKMCFFGSAAVFPHIQGGFREHIVVPATQCVPIPDGFDYTIAAFAEPLAVCLHAVNRAPPVTHKNILVTGVGPIGCLTIMVAKLAGCKHITATDIEEEALKTAASLGADETINVKSNKEKLDAYESGRGYFDMAFECSGNPLALQTCLNAVKPSGTIVQVGMMPVGENPVRMNKLLSKELSLMGTFRFHEEFDLAVDTLINHRIDVAPLLTGIYKFEQADDAFKAAINRKIHMKIQLQFDDNV